VTSPNELGGKIHVGYLANNGKFKMRALEPSLSHEVRRPQILDCRQKKKIFSGRVKCELND